MHFHPYRYLTATSVPTKGVIPARLGWIAGFQCFVKVYTASKSLCLRALDMLAIGAQCLQPGMPNRFAQIGCLGYSLLEG